MYKIGIYGATGKVGSELLKIIHIRKFPYSKIRLFASQKSSGKKLIEDKKEFIIETFYKDSFKEIDIAFFCVSGKWSIQNRQFAEESGCIVIDNSSAFRLFENTPLIVPEINIDSIKKSRFISNPNCTTLIAAIPLWVLHKKYKLKKVIISTYQAASGAGKEGMDELLQAISQYRENRVFKPSKFQYDLAYNIIPHIDDFEINGYTKEEMKVTLEIRKIFNVSDLLISCTAVRIPVLRAHSESITVETELKPDINEIRDLIKNTNGIVLKDDINNNIYPMPITSSDNFDVEVGRIRKSIVFENGIDFFVSGDQLLKGAALNALQIAEKMVERTV
ncbi:MAG: aspartate-semialdehyde dehydrogenase [Candidatus Muirbacterium halophilum]|nr:aspartate-semialdehyde dehydrogenase [Candidatus Muirbacterium halophilum]MCK9474496.1 aspartate-semialdehyde dehydrogenase [Candidatus Muirbacterium halophilum]